MLNQIPGVKWGFAACLSCLLGFMMILGPMSPAWAISENNVGSMVLNPYSAATLAVTGEASATPPVVDDTPMEEDVLPEDVPTEEGSDRASVVVEINGPCTGVYSGGSFAGYWRLYSNKKKLKCVNLSSPPNQNRFLKSFNVCRLVPFPGGSPIINNATVINPTRCRD